MRNLLVVLIALTAAHGSAKACINMLEPVPGVTMDMVQPHELANVEVDRSALITFIRERGMSCSSTLAKGCNDLVIAHLFAKDFPSALLLSAKLVASYPNDYSVVITHAAALELNGRPGDAIPFMERALELNPKSHLGSEWIHLNLLKQRVNGIIDPWALIGMDLRPDGQLTVPADAELEGLLAKVHYQVNDRQYFTVLPDTLFGALVFAYADLLQLNAYKNPAKRMYDLAREHGYSGPRANTASVDTTRSRTPANAERTMSDAIPPAQPKEKSSSTFYGWAFVVVAAAGMTVFIWRNSKSAS